MSRYRSDPEMLEPPPKRSACANVLRYTWKTISFLFSHITLVSMVVSYCVLGAITFQSLEAEHEKDVKRNISKIRNNVTDELWKLVKYDPRVLYDVNFTKEVMQYLKEFENEIIKAMTKDGWDGDEDIGHLNWTKHGALFYSIIVITTIGYGHIAPKTTWGKVVTIFYAILGIPLMLLCLSNIGDIMATSFRFIYWKVCCYVCTKTPKKKKRARGRSVRSQGGRFSNRSRSSFRRSVRTSTRSADSGIPLSEMAPSSYSDTELRYHDDPRGSSLPRARPSQQSRFSDSTASNKKFSPQQRGGSLDRRRIPKSLEIAMDPVLLAKAPVITNRYVLDHVDQPKANHERRATSMPRTHYLELPGEPSPASSREDLDSLKSRGRKKRTSPSYNPSPRIMSPLGFGHRQKYLDDPESDPEEYYYEEDEYYYDAPRARIKPVPIWLCVFLVIGYIFAGAFLFSSWEGWDYLDSAYFCFITLTTIGFGDFVPAKNTDEETSIALCSLYLLFGIALLAMSFNLVQEEVIANVKSVAKTLGIIKREDEEEEDD